MERAFLGRVLYSRWFTPVAACLLIGLYLALQLEIQTPPSDSRSLGTLEDLHALASRDDLNLLFLLVDTLRADRLGAYGYARDTSPALDELAATGIRFAHHRSQSSWTKVSMASLWTGLYPAHTGVLRSSHALAEEARLPAEILREAGFATVGVWRNGWVAPNFGFSQGFDVYQRPRAGPVPPSVRRENPWVKVPGTDEDVTLSALEFLRTSGHERWFLYLHYMDVHQYVSDAASARFGTSYSDIYDNAIHWIDRHVAELLRTLERRGLRDRTIVVLASDHGEAFGEHGREGHARDLYAEVTSTPLVVGLPFRLEPGVVIEVPTENVDLWPTLLELLGLPPLAHADGRSLLPEVRRALRDTPASGDGAGLRFAHLDQSWGQARAAPRPIVAVDRGRFRLVHHAADPDRSELYDLEQDPLEQTDIAALAPDAAAELRERADAYLASSETPWGTEAPPVELDEMELGQLRALGYVVE